MKFESTPSTSPEREKLEITTENKEEIYKDYYDSLERVEEWDYKYWLWQQKHMEAETQDYGKSWREDLGEPPDTDIKKIKEIREALRQSEILSDVAPIVKSSAVADELGSFFRKIPEEEKKEKFVFTLAEAMRSEITHIIQKMGLAYDQIFEKRLSKGMTIEEAIDDYNANMQEYPDQQIKGEKAKGVIEFYSGESIREIKDKYKKLLPEEIFKDILKYDKNFSSQRPFFKPGRIWS